MRNGVNWNLIELKFLELTAMEELLALEGIIVIEDQIQNFKEIVWDPSIALAID